jgi:hypothetical protein
MTEQYDVAAERHHRVAVHLHTVGELDDAAYHYGLVGENGLKDALHRSGVVGTWQRTGIKPRKSPMGQHFPKLHPQIQLFISDIRLHASGRVGAALYAVVSNPAFANLFQGWSIDIRYADTLCTPVNPADCQRWARDADLVLRRLVLMV